MGSSFDLEISGDGQQTIAFMSWIITACVKKEREKERKKKDVNLLELKPRTLPHSQKRLKKKKSDFITFLFCFTRELSVTAAERPSPTQL